MAQMQSKMTPIGHCPVDNLAPEQNGELLTQYLRAQRTFIERNHGPKPKFEIWFVPLTYTV
jgi:hypothetical protein